MAIGELAAGLGRLIWTRFPKICGPGRHGDSAISESQERMAVVVDPKDVNRFLGMLQRKNLEAVTVAVVTEEPRLKMDWRGKTIVDLSRAFWTPTGHIRGGRDPGGSRPGRQPV